jgi:serine/threonine protein phosphatase PrpC
MPAGAPAAGDSADAPSLALECPACHSRASAGDRFCEFCGHSLADASADADGAGTGRSRCAVCGTAEISADGYCERCGRRQPSGRDHVELDTGVAAGVSDRGRLPRHNEDAMVIARAERPGGAPAVVAVVCDGVSTTPLAADAAMAAAKAGATALARSLSAGRDPEGASRTAVAKALGAVSALTAPPRAPTPDGSAPSCTYVSAVVTESVVTGTAVTGTAVTGTSVTVAWVGDSRAYWLAASGGGSAQLTEDDSWAAAQVAAGEMSEDAAYADPRSHAITGWLGADAGQVTPHVATFTPAGPGAVLVCSDGLWNYLPGAEMLAAAVPAAATAPLQAARDLVQLALREGGHDNITAVVIPWPAEPEKSSEPPAHVS